MRAFLAACAVVLVIAFGVGFFLDHFVQQPVSVAFATTEVRL
jgi:hypothetical protein